jgi:hypothetical protein
MNMINRTNMNTIKSLKGISSLTEAMETFKINFDVNRVPLYTNVDGTNREVEGTQAMVRNDNNSCIGVVSGKYPIINPYDKFKAYETIADEGIIEFINGGTYGKYGGNVYLQARIKDTMNQTAKKGEIVEKRITFLSSYNGTKKNEIMVNVFRLVCENGMVIPEKAMTTFKVRNSKFSEGKLEGAVIVMEEIINEYRKIDEFFFNLMDTKPLTNKQIENFVEMVLPSETTVDEKGKISKVSTRTTNRRNSMIETIHNGIGQELIQTNNLWKMLQGVTCFTNNVEGAKKKNHFEYVHIGTGAEINETAYSLVSSALNDYSVFS